MIYAELSGFRLDVFDGLVAPLWRTLLRLCCGSDLVFISYLPACCGCCGSRGGMAPPLMLNDTNHSDPSNSTTLNQSRLFKRGEHLLAVGLEFQFPGERVQVFFHDGAGSNQVLPARGTSATRTVLAGLVCG